MANKMKAVQYVTKQNLTKAFGTFEGKMNRRFDRLEGSIENLADAVRQGFESVDARFNAVDARFDAMDQKIDKVRDDLKGDIGSLQGDVQRIDNRLGRQQEIIDETKQTTRILDGRMAVVEAKVGVA